MDNWSPVIVTGYTPTVPYYQASAEQLQQDCDKLGLVLYMEHCDDTGCWGANTRAKAGLYRRWMQDHQAAAVFLDADMRLFDCPGPLTGPMCATPFPPPDIHLLVVRSTPLYLTPDATPLLERWYSLCQEDANQRPTSDHGYLGQAIRELRFPWQPFPHAFASLGISHSTPKRRFLAR